MTSKRDEDTLISVQWPEGERGSIRTPEGLRERVNKFIRQVGMETGVEFSRNEFVLQAIRFYLRYLLQASSTKDLVERLKEEFSSFDFAKSDSIKSPAEDTDGSQIRDDRGENLQRQPD